MLGFAQGPWAHDVMTRLSPSCRCPGASRGEMGPPKAPEVSTPTLPAGCKDRWEDWAPRRAASLSAFRTFSKRRITSTSYTHFINSRPLAKPKLSWAFKNRRVFALLRVFFCFVFCFFGLLFYVFLRVLVIHVFFSPHPALPGVAESTEDGCQRTCHLPPGQHPSPATPQRLI